jgi:hypothetical protein
METIIIFIAGIAFGLVLGKLKEFNAVQEVEEGNRTTINYLNTEIEELHEQLKEKAA